MFNPKLDKEKDNKFFIELYPSSTSYDYQEVLDNLLSISKEYAFITHTQDISEDGSLKKPHTHIFVNTSIMRSRKAVGEDIGLNPQYIQYAISKSSSLRYLLHLDDKDKFQYSQDLITTNIFNISSYFINKDELLMSTTFTIFSAIQDNSICNIYELSQWAFSTGNPLIIKNVQNKSYYWTQIFKSQQQLR